MEERERISGHLPPTTPEGRLLIVMAQLKERNNRITKSITDIDDDKPLVCILGLQHAHDVIEKLRSKGIECISCFARDSWSPKDLDSTIDSSYPTSIRKADGIMEFSSVDAAMDRLREILLPYTIESSKRLDSPTDLTSRLIRSARLPFFSIASDALRVSAITKIDNEEDERKALSLKSSLHQGCFFSYRGVRYFGLPAINHTETSELAVKILRLS